MNKETVSLGLGTVEVQLDNSGKILDFLTGKLLKELSKSPEEPVRQWYEQVLVETNGFDKDQINIEVPIKMGTSSC